MTFFIDFFGVGEAQSVEVLQGAQRRVLAWLPRARRAAGSLGLGGGAGTDAAFKPGKNLAGSSGRSKGAASFSAGELAANLVSPSHSAVKDLSQTLGWSPAAFRPLTLDSGLDRAQGPLVRRTTMSLARASSLAGSCKPQRHNTSVGLCRGKPSA